MGQLAALGGDRALQPDFGSCAGLRAQHRRPWEDEESKADSCKSSLPLGATWNPGPRNPLWLQCVPESWETQGVSGVGAERGPAG